VRNDESNNSYRSQCEDGQEIEEHIHPIL
jgi:hypothetical protein